MKDFTPPDRAHWWKMMWVTIASFLRYVTRPTYLSPHHLLACVENGQCAIHWIPRHVVPESRIEGSVGRRRLPRVDGGVDDGAAETMRGLLSKK